MKIKVPYGFNRVPRRQHQVGDWRYCDFNCEWSRVTHRGLSTPGDVFIRPDTAHVLSDPNKVVATKTNAVVGRVGRKNQHTEPIKVAVPDKNDLFKEIYGTATPNGARERYLAHHEQFCKKMIEVTKAKNADYTGGSDDPFANFRLVEKMDVTTAEVGFLTRMLDKFARIRTFVKKGVLQVKDEQVADTLHDLANYCALFSGYLAEKRLTGAADSIAFGFQKDMADMLVAANNAQKKCTTCGGTYGPGQANWEAHRKTHHKKNVVPDLGDNLGY